MKKFQMAFIAIFALFLLSTMSSFAQGPNDGCEPCFGNYDRIIGSENGGITSIVTKDSENQISYKVGYDMYQCPDNTTQYIKLTTIKAEYNSSPHPVSIEFAMRDILERFGPFGLQPYTKFYFIVPSCWTYESGVSPEGSSYVPCPNVHCCVVEIAYQRLPRPDPGTGLRFEITYINNINSTNYDLDCITDSPTPCFHVCDAVSMGYKYRNEFRFYGCEPCSFDWEPGKYASCLINENDPNSLMSISYTYRVCPDGTKEVFINYLSTFNTVAYSNVEMYNRAIKAVLSKTPFLFNNMNNIVKLSTMACWKRIEQNNQAHLVPCELDDCCYTIYDIRHNGINNQLYVHSHNTFNNNPCNNCSAYFPECNVCFCGTPEVFEIPAHIILSKSAVFEPMQTNSEICSINPNPTKDKIEININEASKGKITLRIVDILGNQVFALTETKNVDQHTFNVSTSEFATGIYNFVITIDDKPIYNGKFIKL